MALPPTTPAGLIEDSENVNNWANSEDPTFVNRAGQTRRTQAGIDADAQVVIDGVQSDGQAVIDDIESQGQAAIQSTGWFVVGEFADGFEYTAANQVGRDDDGNMWSYNGALPFTVTAATVPSEPDYTNRGDAALRSALAGGTADVDGETASDVASIYKDSVAAGARVKDIPGAALKTVSGEDKRTQKRAVVSFIFDDSTNSAIGAIEPAFDSRGITCGIAPFSNGFNTSGKMDLAKLLSLQEKGYEILSHGDSLIPVAAGANPANIELELRQSYEKMRGLGLDIKGFVPLQSELDPEYIPLMMRYYTYGFPYYKGDATGVDALQDENLDPSYLFRTNLWAVGLTAAKEIVDLAIANDGYVQFYDHDPTQASFPNSMPTVELEELLDYCQSQGVDIVNPSDAIDRVHSSTIKTVSVRKADSEAANGAYANRENLIVDSQFSDFINITGADSSRNWVASPAVANADFSVLYYGTGTELRLDPDGVPVGQQLIVLNKQTEFLDYPAPSSLCFSVELRGTEQMTNRYDVTVEIQLRAISDDSVVDSASSGLVDIDLTSAKRFFASVEVPDAVSGGFYAQCFVRAVCTTASTNGLLIMRKPMLNEGMRPAPYVDSKKTLPVTSIGGTFSGDVGSGETKLTFTNSATNGAIDIATNGDITINKPGIYAMECSVNIFSTTAGDRLVVFPKLNGSDMRRVQSFTGGTQNQVDFTLVRKFSKDDVINFYALQTSGTDKAVSADLYSRVLISTVGNLG